MSTSAPFARLPMSLPVDPMLAKSMERIPNSDSGQEWIYEPKWDGFRALIARDGQELEIFSRAGKPLLQYFPELREPLLEALPEVTLVDGEVVVRRALAAGAHLDWDALSARIHPAASRIALLSASTPAEVILFDVLALGPDDLRELGTGARRKTLADAVHTNTSVHLSRATTDAQEAARWLDLYEGAGLDGVIAKPADAPYSPGKRTMVKVKHRRTADVVLVGYRTHKSGQGVGSLLVGLYGSDGGLRNVGGISAFSADRRLELVDELADLVIRDERGNAAHAETERSRFSSSKDVSFVPLRPERVIEVGFDQLQGHRFRHAVSFIRWRPDREPGSCLLDQVERAPAYDLARILS